MRSGPPYVHEKTDGPSGGQAHRLALARLFLTDPTLILLDEPTAYLDGQTRDQVLAAILRFAQGRALLIATHDEAVAAQLPHRWLLDQQQLYVFSNEAQA